MESIQDITATVNVVSGDNIDRFQAFDFDAIQEQTAGLSLDRPNARNSRISMRGVSVDPESGVQAAVDVFWNDADVRPDIAFNLIYDMERVEVLRGPQGTLQGKTSPGGAINMITKRADLEEATGFVQATASDNDGANTQVAYGAPLVEGTLGVRVAAVYDTNNGADVKNITTGFDDQEAKAWSARLSTVWQVTDDLNAELVYQYLDRNTDDPKAMSGTDSLDERPTLKANDRKALGKTDNEVELDFDLVNLLFDWEVADHTVSGVVAYQHSNKKGNQENDRAHYITTEAPTDQNSQTKVSSIAYELRVASMDNEFWDYMVGVYYQDLNTRSKFYSKSVVSPEIGGIGFETFSKLPIDSNNFAIFTFNTFYLTSDLQLEFGLRWTDYDNRRRADVFFEDLTYLPPPLAPLEDVIRSGFAANFPIHGVSDAKDSNEEDQLTGSLKLRWDWTDDISLYGAYNRGYRPSGISLVPSPNIGFLPNGEDDLLYDDETSDAFELGFKSRLMDGRATLNGALYYQTFDGYLGFVRAVQVLNDEGAPVDLPGGFVFNGDANIWGVEFEGQILLTETWNFGGAMSYSKGEWDGATKPCNQREPGELVGSCDIDGDALGGEPEWSVSLNSEYYYPLENTEIYIRGLYKYTDNRLNTDASAGIGAVADEFESFNIVNLYTGWRSSDFSWDVSVWVKNVTDEDEVTFQQGHDQYDLALSGGSYTQTNILPERTVGVTARYNFF